MYGCESWTIKKDEAKELMLSHCGVGEDSWESLGLQGELTSPSWRKSVLNIHWKDRCWSWNSNILVTWCKELTHLKRPWCWDWQKAGGEGDSRGWDGWMASVTQWMWVWVGSRSWWWAGTPGMLQSMELQRITHNLAIEHKFFRQLGGRSNFFQCVLDPDCFQLKIICMPETLLGVEFCPPYRDSKSLFLVSHISLSQLL